METTLKGINIAPSSTHGHFIKETEQVIMLDEVTETFDVKGASKLVTTNHTTLKRDEDCTIICQTVYEPFKQMVIKSRD